jgi:hypothetical protein
MQLLALVVKPLHLLREVCVVGVVCYVCCVKFRMARYTSCAYNTHIEKERERERERERESIPVGTAAPACAFLPRSRVAEQPPPVCRGCCVDCMRVCVVYVHIEVAARMCKQLQKHTESTLHCTLTHLSSLAWYRAWASLYFLCRSSFFFCRACMFTMRAFSSSILRSWSLFSFSTAASSIA